MMKSRTLILAVLVLACASTSAAAGKSEFSLAPVGGYHWGHTLYRFELLGVIEDSVFPAGTGLGSELIFPLDFPTVGAEAEFRYVREGLPIWTVTAHFSTEVSNPGDVFTDRDWYHIPNGLIWNFSWTESEIDGSFTEIGLEATRLITARDFLELSLVVAVDYQKISQDALGFTGAQHDVYDDDPTLDFYVFSDSRKALAYEISYLRPRLGLAPAIKFGRGCRFDMSVEGTPLVRISDTDNHLLRSFETKADGRGWGLFAGGSLRFDLGAASASNRAFLAFQGNFSRTEANLASTAVWYGDDPIDPQDNTGTQIRGIPHNIRSTQYSLGVSFGYLFH